MEIINVMAISLDGKIAAYPLESDHSRRMYNFTNEADRTHVKESLTEADAVIIGANSLRAAGGKAWSIKNKKGKYPIWIILTEMGLEEDLPFWSQSKLERWLVSPRKIHSFDERVVARVYDKQNPAKYINEKLIELGCTTSILFGGSSINRIFYEQNLVDRIKITICPLILAKASAIELIQADLPSKISLTLESSNSHENHVFLEYRVNNTN